MRKPQEGGGKRRGKGKEKGLLDEREKSTNPLRQREAGAKRAGKRAREKAWRGGGVKKKGRRSEVKTNYGNERGRQCICK